MNKKGFTLIEVVLSIAMLCVISVVLISLLVKAHHIEQETEKMDMVMLNLQNEIERLYGQPELEESTVFKFFDAYWTSVDLEERFFMIQTNINQEKRGLYEIEVIMWEEDRQIMTLTTKRYIERSDL